MKVRRIGFGGMSIPNVDADQAVATLNRALDLGVNFIDTARIYGEGDSERKIGLVMRDRRGECYVSSRSPDMSYDGMKRDIDESLRALRTDSIDLYEPHDVSTQAKYDQLVGSHGALQALQDAKQEGKIRHIGFTSHDWELTERMIRSGQFEAGLITYNLADRQAADGTIDLAEQYHVGLFVMKVFGNGKLLRLSPPNENRRPTVEQCLRFALSNQRLPLILTGVKSPGEIEQNVGIANTYKPMTAAEADEMRLFGDRLGRGYCYGCGYCLPCPVGIDIPGILQLLDHQERISWEMPQGRKRYAEFSATIDDCLDCAACEQSCPQRLAVRDRLRQAKERFGKPA